MNNLLIALGVGIFIVVILIEGEAYRYGSLTYTLAGMFELGLFTMGFLVGKAKYQRIQ